MALHDYPWLMAGIALPLKELLMKPGTHHVGRLGDGYGSWCLQYGYAYGSTPIAQECRSNGQVGASCVALVSIPDGVTGPVWSPSSFERFKVEGEAIRSRNKMKQVLHVAWNSDFGVQDKNSAKLTWKCHETRFPKRWIVRMINICGFTISEPIGLIEMGLVMLEFSRSDTRTEGHGSHSDRSGLHPRFSKKRISPFSLIVCVCVSITDTQQNVQKCWLTESKTYV